MYRQLEHQDLSDSQQYSSPFAYAEHLEKDRLPFLHKRPHFLSCSQVSLQL
uniref:Uncharacterized protein n=1 Tax=Arundo donax TaxID=35708 RepID=A0A0A9EPE5_ARUDO